MFFWDKVPVHCPHFLPGSGTRCLSQNYSLKHLMMLWTNLRQDAKFLVLFVDFPLLFTEFLFLFAHSPPICTFPGSICTSFFYLKTPLLFHLSWLNGTMYHKSELISTYEYRDDPFWTAPVLL